MSDLEELFNRLKPQQQTPAGVRNLTSPPHSSAASIWSNDAKKAPVSPSSTLSLPRQPPQFHTASNARNSVGDKPTPQSSTERAMSNNLLSLLNINRSSLPVSNASGDVNPRSSSVLAFGTSTANHSGISPSATGSTSLQLTPNESDAFLPRLTGDIADIPANSGPPANTQHYLLDLLTKSSKSTGQSTFATKPEPPLRAADNDDLIADTPTKSLSINEAGKEKLSPSSSPIRQFGSPSANTSFDPLQPPKSRRFDYINPFDQLHSSSPLNNPQSIEEKPVESVEHVDQEQTTLSVANGYDQHGVIKRRKHGSPQEKSHKEVSLPQSVSEPEHKIQMSVSQKLEDVGERLNKEVGQALAAADSKLATNEQKENPQSEDVGSSWSIAEDEDARREEENKVEVYNFPMKPFIALQLQGRHVPRSFKTSTWDTATPVARLKKEFSHDDRILATASQSHIVYAVAPTDKKPVAGLKIIRQDDGKNKHIWAKFDERLSHVQISAPNQGDVEAVLATGVNGTIFFTTLAKSGTDLFDETDVESVGFIMSPPPNSDEPSSTSSFGISSAIKTRAKLSNRHSADYIAVARGRQIHLIAPGVVKDQAYTHPKTRRVNTEKYLSEHSLSINTGKAGKDFCFSEDDTTLVSLDKVGKIKFWDIRPLTAVVDSINQGTVESTPKNELRDPMHTLVAGALPAKSEDKMSPSSIMFLDKDRAFAKGVALRYLLVGYQQNHVLQLWDLGLGKCVQELRFPESVLDTNWTDGSKGKDNNAMCSVTYHPKTGIICVGHPGRNSVYFIHLSAPKYSLPQMDQATYVSALARGDTRSAIRPESTAIMSDMREFSCSRVGDLRCLDLLKTPFPVQNSIGVQDRDDEIMFEIYMMHSKGVVGIPINRTDLGWDAKGKLVRPADAIEKGVVALNDLRVATTSEDKAPKERDSDISSRPSAKSSKKEKDKKDDKKDDKKEEQKPDIKHAASQVNTTKVPPPAPTEIASTELEKKITPSVNAVPKADNVQSSSNPQTRSQALFAIAAGQATLPDDVADPTREASASQDIRSPPASDQDITHLLSTQFDSLYSRLDGDKRIADATGAARQDAVLRLVSSTLTENVESSLQRIVATNIEQRVLPVLVKQVSSVAQTSLSDELRRLIPVTVAKEMKTSLPNAFQTGIKEAFKDPHIIRMLSSEVANEVGKKLGGEVTNTIQKSVEALQNNLLAQFSQRDADLKSAMKDAEVKAKAREQEFAAQARLTEERILATMQESERRSTQVLVTLREEQARLAESMSTFQQLRQQSEQAAQTPQTEDSEQLNEVQRLTHMLNQGNFEQATIEWLQSSQQAQLFDDLFVRINPAYLHQVSPLVALSVSAAVTASFESNVAKRLEWLESVINDIEANDPEILDVAPKILDVLMQRLQGAYMQIAETQPNEQDVLRKVVTLNRRIREVKTLLG